MNIFHPLFNSSLANPDFFRQHSIFEHLFSAQNVKDQYFIPTCDTQYAFFHCFVRYLYYVDRNLHMTQDRPLNTHTHTYN
jgi:hypothetical protein